MAELRFQRGHSKRVTAVDWSPDGKYIATASEDATIIIWDARTGREIKTLTGHKAVIMSLDWTSDSRYLASGALDNGVVVWDWRSGAMEQLYLDHRADVLAVRWHPTEPLLASGGADNAVRIWDFKTKKELEGRSSYNALLQVLEGHSDRVISVDWSPGGEQLISLSDEEEMILWDANFGRQLRAQKIEKGKTYKVRWSPDGKHWVGVHGGGLSLDSAKDKDALLGLSQSSGSRLSVWAAPSGELLREIPTQNGFALTDLAISPDSRLVAAGGMLARPGIWELASGRKLFDLTSTTISSDLGWSPDGNFIALGWGGILQIHSAVQGRVVHPAPHPRRVEQVTWSPGGHWISGASSKAIKIWDLSSLNLIVHLDQMADLSWRPGTSEFVVRSLPDKEAGTELHFFKIDKGEAIRTKSLRVGRVDCLAWSPDGKKLAVGGGTEQAGEVRLLGPDGTLEKKIQGHSDFIRKLAWSPDSKYLATASLMKAQLKRGTEGKVFISMPDDKEILIIWNVDEGGKERVIQKGTNKKITVLLGRDGSQSFSEEITGHKQPITGMSWRADGRYLVTADEAGIIKAWDVKTGKLKRDFTRHRGKVNSVQWNPAEETFASSGVDGTARIWKMDSGEEVEKTISGITATVTVHERMLEGHEGEVLSAAWSSDGKYLLTGGEDNLLKIWEKNKERISIINFQEAQEYIAFTPDGYYVSTRRGTDALHFLSGNQVFLFDQFDLRYNRPDIVLEKTPGRDLPIVVSYNKAYLKRLAQLNFTEAMLSDDFHTPELSLLNREALPALSNEKTVRLEIEANDARNLLDRLQVFVNNVPVYGNAGKNLRPLEVKNHRATLEVELSPGDNKIEVSVRNQAGVESLRETTYITYEGPAPKPDLYVVGLGVAHYNNPALNLSYPLVDVEEVAALFKQKEGTAFEHVFVDTLLDASFTPENLKSLRQRLLQSRVDDQVILFVAGHGVLDQDLNYYLATAGMDFFNPEEKGVSYDQLERLLDGIPARRKLLLIDACHSGELDKSEVVLLREKRTIPGEVKFRSYAEAGVPKMLGTESIFGLMKNLFVDLRRSTGATVISSAAGVEFAIESDDYQNGVFTYCLLNGLQARKADLDQDGQVMISELQTFLTREVARLTDNFQRPTFRMENIGYDWQVW